MQRWKEEDIDYLTKNYKRIPNKILSEKLGKSERAVLEKAFKLRLKKYRQGIYYTKYQYAIQLSKEEEQVLLGSLLGDGGIERINITGRFREAHSIKQKEYLLWKKPFLQKFIPNTRLYDVKYKYKNEVKLKSCIELKTKCFPILNKYYNLFYPKGKKTITKEILNKITELGLLIWYLDDGNYSYNGYSGSYFLATCGSLEKQKLIQEWFKKRWNLNTEIVTNKKRKDYLIRLNVKEGKQFFEILYPLFIKYKLPEKMKYKFGLNKEKQLKAKETRNNYIVSDKGKQIQKKYYNKNKSFILKRTQYQNLLKYTPQLCQSIKEEDLNYLDGCIAERKLDGIRAFISIFQGKVKIVNRNKENITKYFPELQKIKDFVSQDCILDCEICCFKNNKDDFHLLQKRFCENPFKINLLSKTVPAKAIIFDIICLGSKVVAKEPLINRKKMLNDNVKKTEVCEVIEYTTDIIKLWNKAKENNWEGIILKRLDSPYIYGRSWKFMKLKFKHSEDIKFTDYEVNNAGITLINDKLRVLCAGKQSIAVKEAIDKKGYAICEIEYLNKEPSGMLRQPTFKVMKNLPFN